MPTEASHRTCIALSPSIVGSTKILSHKLTGQKVEISSTWSLSFSPDGNAFCWDGSGQTMWCNELLNQHCFVMEDGRLYIHDVASGTITWMKDALKVFSTGTCLRDGAVKPLVFYSFAVAQHGQKIWWHLRSFQDLVKDIERQASDADHIMVDIMADDYLSTGLRHEAAKKIKKKKPVPANLDLESVRACLPQISGCYPFFETGGHRIRAFYLSPAGIRLSVSSSVAKDGLHDACVKVLVWAWTQHTVFTGEQSPWDT
mmetsp:Transcript_89595/g.253939  ORF Transcript_89595/g.253939 Transcript_89595/m.253939 type:complete len:258 (-) Transcript_89595:152-925(-)|eukprot:CAMPEP_0179237924 /NCGR_PEP_ID=MMETSP0797-20121207/14688_1 /TAXON_ID=47934 /ORGANISM="Dinophysis acuminata, Strain DAEP01" /LENGTH=257 /DNA_ID=CAMNT_0020945215 /DNA_START=72 /DNA_END=845 /DNA_ORIENTATION=+